MSLLSLERPGCICERAVIIVQARMGSARLPGKMILPLGGVPILSWVLRRLSKSRSAQSVVLATSSLKCDDALVEIAMKEGVPVFRGPEDDVLGRFVGAAKKFEADIVVRVCGDNPFVDPGVVDMLVRHHSCALATGAKPSSLYTFNHIPHPLQDPARWADGLGAEAFCFSGLLAMSVKCVAAYEREHITLAARNALNNSLLSTFAAPNSLARPEVRLDLDTIDDYKRLCMLVAALGADAMDADGAKILSTWDVVEGFLSKS